MLIGIGKGCFPDKAAWSLLSNHYRRALSDARNVSSTRQGLEMSFPKGKGLVMAQFFILVAHPTCRTGGYCTKVL
jgi:hypothetical protein